SAPVNASTAGSSSTNCATAFGASGVEVNTATLERPRCRVWHLGTFRKANRSFFARLYLPLLAFIQLSTDLVAHRHSPIHLAFNHRRRPTMGEAAKPSKGIHNGKAKAMLEKGRCKKIGLGLVAAAALCLSTWTGAEARPFGLL